MKLEKEVEVFAMEMQKQLNFNAVNKNGWRSFTNKKEIIVELEYHKAKLMLAIKERNIGAIREYISDCANNLMFLGVSFGLFDDFVNDDKTFEMKKGIFNEISIYEQTINNSIKSL